MHLSPKNFCKILHLHQSSYRLEIIFVSFLHQMVEDKKRDDYQVHCGKAI